MSETAKIKYNLRDPLQSFFFIETNGKEEFDIILTYRSLIHIQLYTSLYTYNYIYDDVFLCQIKTQSRSRIVVYKMITITWKGRNPVERTRVLESRAWFGIVLLLAFYNIHLCSTFTQTQKKYTHIVFLFYLIKKIVCMVA